MIPCVKGAKMFFNVKSDIGKETIHIADLIGIKGEKPDIYTEFRSICGHWAYSKEIRQFDPKKVTCKNCLRIMRSNMKSAKSKTNVLIKDLQIILDKVSNDPFAAYKFYDSDYRYLRSLIKNFLNSFIE